MLEQHYYKVNKRRSVQYSLLMGRGRSFVSPCYGDKEELVHKNRHQCPKTFLLPGPQLCISCFDVLHVNILNECSFY